MIYGNRGTHVTGKEILENLELHEFEVSGYYLERLSDIEYNIKLILYKPIKIQEREIRYKQYLELKKEFENQAPKDWGVKIT